MDLNTLKQYMDFYKGNLAQPDYSAHNGFNPTPSNPNGDAADWAMRMMGGQSRQQMQPMPDYFGANSPPSYTAPQAFNPQRPAQQTPSAQIPNYLASLMRR